MKFTQCLIPLFLSSAVLGSPTPTLEKRSTTICGQYDSVATGTFDVYQDLWGEANGSGSQCTKVTSEKSGKLVWSTSWSWSGGPDDVKSYANAAITMTATKLSSISTIPTTWDWSYSGSNIVADVSYDTFTSSSASGSAKYEVMVWLAALGGAGPISSTGSPIATPSIGGVKFKLFSGPNSSTTVYSFVAESEQTSFSGDLKEFYTYLINNQGFSSSQYLLSIGAGTEAFTGSNAVFSTSSYKAAIN